VIGSERGSATIWTMGLAAVIVAFVLVAVTRTSAVLGRHQLDRTADLAALSAAAVIGTGQDPCAVAARIAGENQAQLAACATELDASARAGIVGIRLTRQLVLPLVGARTVSARARAGRLPVGT
jgi:secretion/DNA translocation related TadE-like protein